MIMGNTAICVETTKENTSSCSLWSLWSLPWLKSAKGNSSRAMSKIKFKFYQQVYLEVVKTACVILAMRVSFECVIRMCLYSSMIYYCQKSCSSKEIPDSWSMQYIKLLGRICWFTVNNLNIYSSWIAFVIHSSNCPFQGKEKI